MKGEVHIRQDDTDIHKGNTRFEQPEFGKVENTSLFKIGEIFGIVEVTLRVKISVAYLDGVGKVIIRHKWNYTVNQTGSNREISNKIRNIGNAYTITSDNICFSSIIIYNTLLFGRINYLKFKTSNITKTDLLEWKKKKHSLDKTINKSTFWFFLIGGLSLFNSILYFTGIKKSYIFWLVPASYGTLYISAIAETFPENKGILLRLVGLLLGFLISGIFITIGVLGRKKQQWVVLTGIVLYSLDGILYFINGSWKFVIFHLLVLPFLWSGQHAFNNLKDLEKGLISTNLLASEPWEKRKNTYAFSVVVTIVFGIVTILMTLFVLAYQPVEIVSEAGHFSVKTNIKLSESTQTFKMETVGDIETHIFSGGRENVVYQISYIDYPIELINKYYPSKLLTIILNSFLAENNGVLVSSKNISLVGQPGLELLIEYKSKNNKPVLMQAHTYLVENRFYAITVGYPLTMRFSANMYAFLNSFKQTYR